MSANDERPSDCSPELKAFEAALGGLVPAESRLNRDRLMYLAGAAASASGAKPPAVRFHRPLALFWPAATAALFLVAVGLGALVALRQPAERIVYIERPAAHANPGDAPSPAAHWPQIGSIVGADHGRASGSYLALREQILNHGVGALDAPGGAAEPPDHRDVRNRALLNRLLGS